MTRRVFRKLLWLSGDLYSGDSYSADAYPGALELTQVRKA
jgi:hypothetical protein